MIQLTPQQRILVAIQPLDFRKGMDSIAAICRQRLQEEPFSGTVFVFTNRKRHGIRLLAYDGQGFWLCAKRLSQGRLRFWPDACDTHCTLSASELMVLLHNGDPKAADMAKPWRPLPMAV